MYLNPLQSVFGTRGMTMYPYEKTSMLYVATFVPTGHFFGTVGLSIFAESLKFNGCVQ